MAEQTKSVFLYSKPLTKEKQEKLQYMQDFYVEVINEYIDKLSKNTDCFLSIMNNQPQTKNVRSFEKKNRPKKIGSALSQNAIDIAVKELHNHFIRIRNEIYGYVQNHFEKESHLLLYVSFYSLLNASFCDLDEINLIHELLNFEKKKKKPNKEKVETYSSLLEKISSLDKKTRTEYKEIARTLFIEKLESKRLPFVKKTPIQLDSRLSSLEISHSTQAPFILRVKILGETRWVSVPCHTSKNGIRRLMQYKAGSVTMSLHGNKLKISVPFKKKVKLVKTKSVLGTDVGITDLLYTSEGKRYGTFSGMSKLYEELVETKLGHRSSLRNKRKEYQKRLKKSSCSSEKDQLRKKIHNISRMLNGNKNLNKQQRKYNHKVDIILSNTVKQYVEEVKKTKPLCVFEDLEMDAFDRGKKANKRDSMWIRGKLIKKITEQLDWLGIPYRFVDPAYTSKMCPKCFNVDDGNRVRKSFCCTVCNYKDDSDRNAAINIRERAFDDEIDEIVEKFRWNTKKRHKALKELLLTRHRRCTVAV